ncbi:MAG: HEPN domain-containing protein [Gemmatimonadetes bacterium]|nr:HEPN domain-containing protein [Gemmatimonadota bacterium]
MAPIISRLAEALDPKGRFAAESRVVEIGTALERMYEIGKKKITRKLQNRISGFLGTDNGSRDGIKEMVKEFYDARSEIVHGRRDKMSPIRSDAAFFKGFKIARQSVFKLIREGAPEDWEVPKDDGL